MATSPLTTPYTIKAPAVTNVVTGGVARLTLDAGLNVREVVMIATVTKTSPTADANFNPTLSDAINLIDFGINDKSGKRQIMAQELNELQQAWAAGNGATYYSGVDGNWNVIADTTETDNSVSCTVRTGTWVLRYLFAEPSRDSYAARRFFSLPTKWVDKNGVVTTIKAQFAITIPGPSTVTNFVALTAMATGKYNLKNPSMRAEIVADDSTGPFQGDQIINGVWTTTANSTTVPMLPITHYYRQIEGYTNTTPVIRVFPFQGYWQQTSVFSPNGSGDDIFTYQLKKNAAVKMDTSKKINDGLKLGNNWNSARIGTSSGDVAGTNWPSADVFHLAFDFDDNPFSAMSLLTGDLIEMDLVLAQNTAANKNLVLLSAVYRDALAS